MQKKIIFFNNDSEIKIDQDGENLLQFFSIDESDYCECAKLLVDGVFQEKNPGQLVLKLVREGKFDFLMYLAGLGLIENLKQIKKRARFISMD